MACQQQLTTLLSALLIQGVVLGQTPAPPDDDPFAKAVRTGDPQVVLPFLGNAGQANAMVTPLLNPSALNWPRKQPALVAAARAGHASLVRLLIANGADIRSQGWSALVEAVELRRLAVVRTLLEAGVKAVGPSANTLIASAVSAGSVDIADMLLKQGGSLAGLSPTNLERVASRGPEAMRNWLRQHGVFVPEQSVDERLMAAIWANDLPEVQRIIRESKISWLMGARSAAAAAAATGDKALLIALVGAGSPKNSQYVNSGDGLLRRPLWFAAAQGDASMTEWLLEHGATLDAQTFSGQTALGVATALGHKAVADVLLKHGAKPINPTSPLATKETPSEDVDFPKGFKPPTVAMAPVAIEDAWYASLAAAKDLGAALEASALNLPEVRWVERAEVERLGGEWATESLAGNDPTSALQKGRLARADWMVTTRILPDEGHGRTMVFEVLDTQTAESLALRKMTLPGRLGWPLKFELVSVPDLMKGMRSALASAAHSMQAAQGRQRLACLFFANKAPTDRFVTLAGEALETMAAVAESPTEKLPHVVRFQRSRSVQGEAELGAAGWLEQGEQGLQKVADAFAWGSVSEVGNGAAPRDEVLIKLTWEVWSGGEETVKHEAVCRAGDAEAIMRSLSKKVLSSLPAKGAPTNLKQREAMAQRLMDQAKALSVGGENSSSAEAQQRWRERVGLLEAAHFLNPEKVTLEAMMLVERWHYGLSSRMGPSERSIMDFCNDFQRYTAWNRFVKAHGYGPLLMVFSDEPRRMERWPLTSSAAGRTSTVVRFSQPRNPKMATRHCELARRLIAEMFQFDQCVPADLPPRLREQSLATVGLEYAGLLTEMAKANEGKEDSSDIFDDDTMSLIPDPTLRYRTQVLMWGGIHIETEPHRSRHYSELLALAEDVGLADESLAMLRNWRLEIANWQATLVKAKPDPKLDAWRREMSEDRDTRQRRMAERMTAEVAKTQGKPGWLNATPEVRDMTGYYRSGTVTAISTYRSKLYLAVMGYGTDRVPATTVWEHDQKKGTFTLMTGMEFNLSQDKIGLRAHETGLWMWTSLNGIWQRDWATGGVTHHESKSGLPTDQVLCATDLGGTLYFGGGKSKDGALFSWDAATRGWRVFRRPDAKNGKVGTVEHLLRMGDELLVQEAPPTYVLEGRWRVLSPEERLQMTPTYSLANPKTKTSRDLTAYLRGNNIQPWASQQIERALLVTDRTLWSWDPRHFSRVDLETMTHQPVKPVGDAPAVKGWFRAWAETEDYVWIIMCDDIQSISEGLNINRLFAVKKSDGTVQAAVLLPLVCRITCAVALDKTLWLGVERSETAKEFSALPCLVRVPLGL